MRFVNGRWCQYTVSGCSIVPLMHESADVRAQYGRDSSGACGTMAIRPLSLWVICSIARFRVLSPFLATRSRALTRPQKIERLRYPVPEIRHRQYPVDSFPCHHWLVGVRW